MAAPSVVLVPPTPYDVEKFPPRSSSVSPRTTVTVASARSSRSSYQYHAPTSSETTIFSIYSMYGEGKDGDADGAGSADNPRISYAKRLSNRISEVSMHSDDVYDGVVEVSTKAMVSADGSLSVEPTSYGRQQRNGFVPQVTIRSSSDDAVNSAAEEQSPVPTHTGSTLESSFTPSPRPSNELLSPHQPSSSSMTSSSAPNSPQSAARMPTITRKHSLSAMTNLSQSVASLTHSGPLKTPTPHPNEDPDAFHVRHTYALLDLCGVKGDGFVEGVERTRARVGSSRNSQMDAAQAIADVDEKKKDLDDKERAVLQTLDRYGFYESVAHERLVKMPAAPLSQPLKMIAPATVDAGPAPSAFAAASKNNNAPPPPAPPSLSSLPPPQPLTKEVPRLEKWGRMVVPLTRDEGGNIETWGIREGVSEKKLKRRVYKGVPDRWRSATWVILVRRAVCKAGLGEGHPGFGGERQVEAEMKRLQAVYLEKLEQPSTYDIQIDLDVPRTIGGHVMFKTRYGFGQRALFHVLHSFSLYCDTCGYVQGMGPIASTLLLHLPPSTVYTLLCFMHSSPAYSLHSMFAPGFPGLLEAIYVQERIMQTTMPDVYAALRDKGVGTTAYATKWYITLFVTSLPFQTVLRLWDCWLLEGRDVWVILAAAVVRVFRDHIVAPGASFESILSLLSSFFVPEDEDALLTWMSKMLADTKLRQSMAEWRRTWAGLVKEGKDATALL